MNTFNKIFLILKREYTTRVRKKSFLLISLIGPVVMAALMVVPMGLAIKNSENHLVAVHETGNPQRFLHQLPNQQHLNYLWLAGDEHTALSNFLESDYDYLLLINSSDSTKPVYLKFLHKGIRSKLLEGTIKEDIAKLCREQKLQRAGMDSHLFEEENMFRWESNALDTTKQNEVAFAVALFAAILIYFFIFMYAVQVMRGVMEEKTNRIVELVVTSVKPFELMAGKILGIMLVGFTQFLIWLSMTGTFIWWIYQHFQIERFNNLNIQNTIGQLTDTAQAMEMNSLLNGIEAANLPMMLLVFLIYFIGGYVLYGALFAAVGSAVDSETETQQFMLPITFPLVTCLVLLQWIIQNPNGGLAYWLSMIPFTSPVAMLLRAPFGVSTPEILLSITVLVITCFLTIWLAGRIYKIGILSYGTKPSWSLILKWLKG